MLARIRAFAKSWVALLLLGLLIVSFAIFGIEVVFQPRGGDWAVRAGDRTISGVEFRRLFDNYRQQAQQQSGQPLSVEDAVERGLHLRVLDELAASEAFAALLGRLGIVPADSLVVAEIRKAPIFFNPISGVFERAAYERELAKNELTPERFEGFLRDEIAQSHFVSGVVGGLRAPRVYTAATAAFQAEIRDVSLALVHPGLIQQPAAPTDAQLTAFLNENASQLRRPEFRALTVVRFNAADVANTITVDPAEVQRQFAFRRESLSTPERRTLVQIPAANQAAAQQTAQRLRAGQDPAAVARSLGRDPLPYNNVPLTAITDRRVGEAAFRLQPGQVSDPIQGELGWSVVRVTAVTPGVQPTIEQARPTIEAELRANAAEDRISTLVEQYERAREEGANLPEAARRAGAPALTLAPVTQDGRAQTGQPLGLEPQLLAAAFELQAGEESEVIELGQGRYAAVRVDRRIAPALPALNEVRAPLAQAWTQREVARRLQRRAEELAATARRGGTLEAAARAIDAPFTRVPNLTRSGEGSPVPPQTVADIFGARRGEIFTAGNGNIGILVGRVEAVRFPPAAQLALGVDQRRPAITLDILQEMGEAARRAARNAVKTRTNPERAGAILGVAPADGPATGGGGGQRPAQ